MAYYFKIVGKIYSTDATGSNLNLKHEYEFISDPYTDREEFMRQKSIKTSEYIVDIEPSIRNVSDISLNAVFVGIGNNVDTVFTKPYRRCGSLSTAPDDQYAEQRKELLLYIYRMVFPAVG